MQAVFSNSGKGLFLTDLCLEGVVEYFVVCLVTDVVCYYDGVDEFDVRVDLILRRVLTYGWVYGVCVRLEWGRFLFLGGSGRSLSFFDGWEVQEAFCL